MPDVVPIEVSEALTKAVSTAIDSIRLLQKVHEQKIREQIAGAKAMLKEERDAILSEIRNSVKAHMNDAVARLESKFKAYEQAMGSAAPGIFPQVPPLSNYQMVELQSAQYSAAQVVEILGEVLKHIPNTEDLVIPPEYLHYILAKKGGVIR